MFSIIYMQQNLFDKFVGDFDALDFKSKDIFDVIQNF